jgi:hypothetical protein
LSDLIGELDELIKFLWRGLNVGSNAKGAGEEERAVLFVDLTVGVKMGLGVAVMRFLLESAASTVGVITQE